MTVHNDPLFRRDGGSEDIKRWREAFASGDLKKVMEDVYEWMAQRMPYDDQATREDRIHGFILFLFSNQSRLAKWFDNVDNFAAFLRRCFRNYTIDEYRKAKLRDMPDIPEDHDIDVADQPDELAISSELCHRLIDAIERLPEKLATAVRYRFFESLTSAQIADRVGITESAVRMRLHRATCQLREALEPDDEPPL